MNRTPLVKSDAADPRSPPWYIFPQATTDPSVFRAANARFVEKTAFTLEEMSVPPSIPAPQVVVAPNSDAAIQVQCSESTGGGTY